MGSQYTSLNVDYICSTDSNTGNSGLISRRPLQDVLCFSLTSQPHTGFFSVISSIAVESGQELMNIVAWICVTGVCVCTYRWHHFITALHYIAEQRVTVRSLRCHVSFCETWVWICLFCLTLLKLEIDIRIVYKTWFLLHITYSISSPQNKIFCNYTKYFKISEISIFVLLHIMKGFKTHFHTRFHLNTK